MSVAKGSVFQYRASTGASAASNRGTAVAPPYWVRIVRSGQHDHRLSVGQRQQLDAGGQCVDPD
jgi:hypothetical protein